MATIDQLTLAAVLDAEMLIPVNLFGQTLKIKLGQLLAAQNSLTIVQYSADGADGHWHAEYAATDNYIRISTDGGNTWGPAINLRDPAAQQGADSLYTWMKFADTASPQTSADIYDEPRNTTTAIGWAYNKPTPEESDDPSDYTWARFKGADAVELDTVQEYYAVGASSTLPPTDGWVEVPKNAMPAMTAAKPYLWNYERSTYNNGAYRDTQPRCVGRRGDDGTSITKVTDYYLASSKETGVTTADDGWTTLIASAEASWGVELPYLWNYEKREWSNGFVDYVQPHRIARWASDGKDGVSITKSSTTYSTVHTESQPADSTFTLNAVPVLTPGQWLWSKQEVNYSNGESTKTYSVSRIGANGEGVSVKSTSVTYAKSTTASQPADSQFKYASIDDAGIDLGDYLWTKSTTVYTDNKSMISYSVSRIGSDGANGQSIQGPKGDTYYLHMAYCDSITGSLPNPSAVTGFSTTATANSAYLGTCTDRNELDPTDHTKYKWSRFRGYTPILDPETNKWTYHTDPSQLQLSATVQKFEAIENNASLAVSEAATAKQDANTAKTNATTALTTANTANTNAQAAADKADKAQTTADSAKTTADTAKSTADTAKSTADTASSNASWALSTATQSSKDASTALNKATSVEKVANTANENATSALDKATSALNTAESKATLADVKQLSLADFTNLKSQVATATSLSDLSATVNSNHSSLLNAVNEKVSLADVAADGFVRIANESGMYEVSLKLLRNESGSLQLQACGLPKLTSPGPVCFPFDMGLTESQVNTLIKAYASPLSHTHSQYLTSAALANYVTKGDLADCNYATLADIPSLAGYATQSWVNAQGFLKSHQSLSHLESNSRMDYGWNGLNYFNIYTTAGCVAKANDVPTSQWWHILRFNHANSTGYYTDLAVPFIENSIYYKRVQGGGVANGKWVKVLDELNYSSILDSRYATTASLSSYLAKSGGTMTGLLRLATGIGLEDATGNGMLCYKPTAYTGVANTQWGVGAADVQGVIRSGNADLIHYRNGVGASTIWDSGNFNPSHYATTAALSSYALKAELSGYLPLSGGTITGPINLGPNVSIGVKNQSRNLIDYIDTQYDDVLNWVQDNFLDLSGGTMTDDLLFANSGTTTRQVRFMVGDNDYGRIAAGATATNAGWVEIASADDGNEPIYARQYSGAFATVKRTATLLDGSGNTSFPGNLSASGSISTSGNLSVYGNVSNNFYSLVSSSVNPYLKLTNGSTGHFIQWYQGSLFLGTGINKGLEISSSGNLTCRGSLDFGSAQTAMGDTFLDLNGTITCVKLTQTSDIRLKNITRYLSLDVRDIAAMPMIEFDYRNQPIHAVGTIAQAWLNVLPSAIGMRKDGYYTFQYAEAALISAISIARKVVSHDDRITILEREVAQLTADKQRLEADNLRLNNLLQEIIKTQTTTI